MKKKLLSVLLTVVMVMSLLTGCMAEIMEVKVNPDGSGTITVMAGFTKESLEALAEAESGLESSSIKSELGDNQEEVDESIEEFLSEAKVFEYNGVTYYGDTADEVFESLDDLDSSNSGLIYHDDFDPSYDSGAIRLREVPNEPGCFDITISLIGDDSTESDIKNEIQSQMGGELSREELEELFNGLTMVVKISLPSNIKQLRGPETGIKIENNTVEINLLEVAENIKTSTLFEFTNSQSFKGFGEEVAVRQPRFTDVSSTSWYYTAVERMADEGLVAGVGDGKFGPDEELTYAQFCQILYNYIDPDIYYPDVLEPGKYWAYNAVAYCVETGIIEDRGEINQSNYDVGMTREAAVAGIYRANKEYYSYPTLLATQPEDIPDYNSISEVYRNDILSAYTYGLTSGVDNLGTFDPLSILTRAQICQLIYILPGF